MAVPAKSVTHEVDIVEDFHAKIADFRHLERGVLVRELTNLPIHCRQTADHGNHLLYEHIAETA